MRADHNDAEEPCLKNQRGDAASTTDPPPSDAEINGASLNFHEKQDKVAVEDATTYAHAANPSPELNTNDDDDFPEGGYRAWLVVASAFCLMFMVFGIINSTGALQAYLSSNQLSQNSSEQIAWIFSIQLFLVFFAGLYVGPYFDAHGPRGLVAVGSGGLIVSMLILAECTGRLAYSREGFSSRTIS